MRTPATPPTRSAPVTAATARSGVRECGVLVIVVMTVPSAAAGSVRPLDHDTPAKTPPPTSGEFLLLAEAGSLLRPRPGDEDVRHEPEHGCTQQEEDGTGDEGPGGDAGL